jgi:hypothetical protein
MAPSRPAASTANRVREVLTWLERRGTKRNREGMTRYSIRAPRIFGVPTAAVEERNSVKKGVSWRWVGKETLRDLIRASVQRRLAAKKASKRR